MMGAYTPSEVEQLIMPHMSLDEQFTKESLHFDLERIALLVCMGKVERGRVGG